MNTLLAISILLFNLSCTSEIEQPLETVVKQEAIIKRVEPIEDPYKLKLQIVPFENNAYQLEVTMELEPLAFFISPYSEGTFEGRFNIELAANEQLQMEKTLIELPASKEQQNPFGPGFVKYVKETTTYTQPFTVSSEKDFEVSGSVVFVIEPRCTLEKVDFVIANSNGKLNVRQVISNSDYEK